MSGIKKNYSKTLKGSILISSSFKLGDKSFLLQSIKLKKNVFHINI